MSESEGVLDRVLRVLGSFNEDDAELSARQLAARTGLPPSTLHRLVAELVAARMLLRLPGHRYAIGSRMFELGELSPLALSIREPALPLLQRLYEATGENVHIAVLDGATPASSAALFIGRVTGPASIETLARTGGRLPLHTTGVGKAILAGRDEDWLTEFFRSPLEPETTLSIRTEEALRADLERTRARGFAVTHEEMTLGNFSVAAELPPLERYPPIAIGVVAHLDRFDERRVGAIVVQTAKDLALSLRGR